MCWRRGIILALWMSAISAVSAQEAAPPAATGVPVVLTLKRAVELSLANSKDIQLCLLYTSPSPRDTR